MRRSLFSAVLVSLASLSLLLCATSRLNGQTFNLQTGREPFASLDGLWRFRTGDNPAWADPNFDDSQWPLLHSAEPWSQQGYENYGGFAWYRLTVVVPDGSRNWSIYLGPMETGYQLFADRRLAGSHGTIPQFPDLLRFQRRLCHIPRRLRPTYVSHCHPRVARSRLGGLCTGRVLRKQLFRRLPPHRATRGDRQIASVVWGRR